MPMAVETMATTPNSQSAMDAANDKKRNKLGYHRTSVACGQSTPFLLTRCLLSLSSVMRIVV
jgi:hypothetical protein